MSRPWMPLYVGNYLADTGHLSTLEHGAYLLLLMHYWVHGSLPCDEKRLSLIAKLDSKTWRKVSPILTSFFSDNWQHKRVEAELKKACSISDIRKASAEIRWNKRSANAHADAYSNASLAEPQLHTQSQSQSHKEEGQSGAHAPADAADEERFWSRLDDLGKKGISRSRCTLLLKLNGGDFMEANRALDSAEQAQKPAQYLGAIVRNLEVAGVGSPVGGNPHVPAWVNELRAAGTLVERDGANSWRCLGELLNDAGEVVGF